MGEAELLGCIIMTEKLCDECLLFSSVAGACELGKTNNGAECEDFEKGDVDD